MYSIFYQKLKKKHEILLPPGVLCLRVEKLICESCFSLFRDFQGRKGRRMPKKSLQRRCYEAYAFIRANTVFRPQPVHFSFPATRNLTGVLPVTINIYAWERFPTWLSQSCGVRVFHFSTWTNALGRVRTSKNKNSRLGACGGRCNMIMRILFITKRISKRQTFCCFHGKHSNALKTVRNWQ